MVAPRRLHDETDRQELQCMQAGMKVEDDIDDDVEGVPFGADPFDIIAEIEERQGYALVTS